MRLISPVESGGRGGDFFPRLLFVLQLVGFFALKNSDGTDAAFSAHLRFDLRFDCCR